MLIDKRRLLAGAGASLLALLTRRQAEALDGSAATFVSTAQQANGQYCVVVMSESGEMIFKIPLPARGHDVTFYALRERVLVFARRPGTFAVLFSAKGAVLFSAKGAVLFSAKGAVLFSAKGKGKPQVIKCPKDRHFFGHGVFSADGQLVFATENDFENSRGVIAIYDMMGLAVRRIGEFSSYGIGPHEIHLLNDGKSLVVANGGIETHPDFGRAKLNLGTVAPSLAFIDLATGGLLESHKLTDSLHQLSIRHMAVRTDDKIWFGCQHQGAKSRHRLWLDRLSVDLTLFC